MAAGTVKAGGQALADGVFMRTPLAWAIARQDGSVEVGHMPLNRFAAVPAVRVLAGLGTAMKLGVGRGLLGGARSGEGRRRNRRFVAVLLAAEVAVLSLSIFVDFGAMSRLAAMAVTVVPWIATLGLIRFAGPSAMWRYHGAEHKAVTAHEAGTDLEDLDAVLATSRIHNRCGTNLVLVMMVLGLALLPLPSVVQIPLFLVALAVTAELLSIAANRPYAPASRILLAGGRALQRYVTTAEPTREEQAIGCLALQTCLAEHAKVAAAFAAEDQAAAVAGALLGLPADVPVLIPA